jgi:hypothetical protein
MCVSDLSLNNYGGRIADCFVDIVRDFPLAMIGLPLPSKSFFPKGTLLRRAV